MCEQYANADLDNDIRQSKPVAEPNLCRIHGIFKAVELDPLNPPNVLRLATCYEHEKQFIKAYDWYSRGICFIPSMDCLPSQREKLKCLAELSKDQKDKRTTTSRSRWSPKFRKHTVPICLPSKIFALASPTTRLFSVSPNGFHRGVRN